MYAAVIGGERHELTDPKSRRRRYSWAAYWLAYLVVVVELTIEVGPPYELRSKVCSLRH